MKRPIVSVRVDPVAELGLPDPASWPFSDVLLSKVYSYFCETLRYCDESRTSIVCDTDLFDFGWRLEPDRYPHLRLLAGLLRPTAKDLEGIMDRTGVNEAYAICVGMRHDEKLRELAPRIFFREFRRFLQKDDYALFTDGKPYPAVLVRIDSSLSSAPGYSWHATHVARRFHGDWAILLNYSDCEDSAAAAFPLVLGFARISSLRRSAGTVFLTNECARSGMPDYFGRYLPVGEGEEEPVLSPQDKEVLSLCFSYVSTERRPVYGELLLGFPDEVINRLSAELGLTEMENVNLYVQKSRLRDFCERVAARCKKRRVTPVKLFGSHENIGLAALEEMENADRLERERKSQETIAAGKKAVAEWQAELKAVSSKGPDDFPEDFVIGQMGEKDVIAINKWLHEVRRIDNVSAEMRFMPRGPMWGLALNGKDEIEASDWKFRNSLFGFDLHEPGERFQKIRRIEFNRATTVRRAFEEFFAFLKVRQSVGMEVSS
jgi:hypothetical protein